MALQGESRLEPWPEKPPALLQSRRKLATLEELLLKARGQTAVTLSQARRQVRGPTGQIHDCRAALASGEAAAAPVAIVPGRGLHDSDRQRRADQEESQP